MIAIVPSSPFKENTTNATRLNNSSNDRNNNLQNGSPLASHDNEHQSNRNVLDKIYLDVQALFPCCAVKNTTTALSPNEPTITYKNNGSSSLYFEQYLSRIKSHMEPTFKCLVIGDIGVGKTSFVQRYVYHRRIRDYKGTLGVDFALKIVKWSENINIKLQMWDIAGQERFASMTRVYYKDAHACIVMFDLTHRDSFLKALKWKQDLDSKCSLPDGSPVPCILLANKCDLPSRQVEQAELEKFCQDHHFIGFDEISVKEGRMVEESMRFLLNDIMRRYSDLGDSVDTSSGEHTCSSAIRLDSGEMEPSDSRCSC